MSIYLVAETWKQSKCPSIEEWIKMWCVHTHTHTHTHNGILLSHKNNEILPFVETWLDSKIIKLSQVRQRKTNVMYRLYVESKNNTNELIYKTETDSQTWKTNLWLPRGGIN